MRELSLAFIDGNWVFNTACALSDSEFGTLRLPALATLNETEEKKLAARGADNSRAITQATTIALCRFLTSLFRRSNSEWLELVCKDSHCYDSIGF